MTPGGSNMSFMHPIAGLLGKVTAAGSRQQISNSFARARSVGFAA
jgi:hypothetical protein